MESYKTLGFIDKCDKNAEPIIKLWMLRILVNLSAVNQFMQKHHFKDDSIAEFLGLGHYIEGVIEFNPQAIKRELSATAAAMELQSEGNLLPSNLQNNLKSLSTQIELDDVEQCLVGFSILTKTELLLVKCVDYLSYTLSTSKAYHALSVILNIPESAIKKALSANSNLVRSGILKLEEHITTLDEKLELVSSRFADAVLIGETDLAELFKGTVAKSLSTTLGLSDYEHVKQLAILLPFLQQAIKQGLKGINIYIYGPAGTGKTQLAKVLAQELQTDLFEVTTEDDNGHPISGERRLRALSAAHSFLSHRKALILFDEAEDVFNNEAQNGQSGGFSRQSTAQRCKAWLNRSLEENATPTIWLANTRNGLDPAFIRRYAMVFELAVPPELQRKKVLNQYAGKFLSEHVVKQLAKADSLAPAVVANAAKVTDIIRGHDTSVNTDAVFTNLINQTLEAQDHPTINVHYHPIKEQAYNTDFLNTSVDIAVVIAGLKASRQGRLCFYGPPGTGKTALSKHIAEMLELPFICKKASDLLSCHVGKTEKNIARAFKCAREEGAILLMDEIDSLLQHRANAKQSWEQTQVNEMLTQMENFEGIFMASTNLIDTLDVASIRRFDAKIKFDYLNQQQLTDMFGRFCQSFDIELKDNALNNQINHLHAITPGDFALISRQNNFNPVTSLADLISRLEAEQILKGEVKNRMGFI
ncbi:AAA family ATPase [Marinomonas sp. IMCC 4694]|uniref:AAA family ATPase n=1 Tax=Marinomonas sp. IMCC 4694 TaxID=2605432 RepID=UPI0011E65E39|nr:ATP-binding protein [Marinomonas sp. IMCC 4694]TYL48811.1 AAA family ATPase [Marinomonas sp. IMCC 4694]